MGGISGEGTVYSASDHEITPIRWVALVEKELLTLPVITPIRWVVLVEKELLTLPVIMRSPPYDGEWGSCKV